MLNVKHLLNDDYKSFNLAVLYLKSVLTDMNEVYTHITKHMSRGKYYLSFDGENINRMSWNRYISIDEVGLYAQLNQSFNDDLLWGKSVIGIDNESR
jgi:hypothetical protein